MVYLYGGCIWVVEIGELCIVVIIGGFGFVIDIFLV